jgi:signal transduction histidine kinase
MTGKKTVFGWALTAIIVLAPTSVARAQGEHKQVLVLQSTRRDSQFSIVTERELTRMLDSGLARNVDYYSESLDLGRFPEPSYRASFSDYLRLKYQAARFDLVIAMQDAAVEFVTDHRDSLFDNTPAVLLANHQALKRFPNSTGLVHERNYVATLGLIRQLQPDVRNVFIVSGAAGTDRQYEAEFRRQLSPTADLTVTFLSGLATNELEDRLSRLPEHSVVYHLLVSADGAGNTFYPLQYVDRVSAAANAPTYSWVDSTLDHGIVGGSLYSQATVIKRVGELALRVLRGEAADSIPLAALDAHADVVDWRQLKRWGIDEARVPPGTDVRFRDPTIWDRYRFYIVGALALLITQTVLIAGLLIQGTRRRRAEEELRASQRKLGVSYERIRHLGARLLRAQDTERSRIARELHDDICQRVLLLTIELESMVRTNADGGTAAEALTVAQDIAKSLHDLSYELHPTRLRTIGLVAALDRLCAEWSRTGIAIAFTHEDGPSTLSPDLTLCLFRVAQEGLQNAIKYSDATQLSVHLADDSEGLVLTITDNGKGFDVDAAWGQGLGLVSMTERLAAIGGSFDISSKPATGTRLTASVPAEIVRITDPVPLRSLASA